MKTLRIITASIVLSIGGCAVNGTLELPSKYGKAGVTFGTGGDGYSK